MVVPKNRTMRGVSSMSMPWQDGAQTHFRIELWFLFKGGGLFEF